MPKRPLAQTELSVVAGDKMAEKPTSKSGGDLFIVDNSDADWKVLQYLREWTELAYQFDIATGFFEIGSLLALDNQWQKLDKIRILMGGETTRRTRTGRFRTLSACFSAASWLRLPLAFEPQES